MSCDRSIRRPLFFSGGLLVGALQVGYNQRVMDKCPAVHWRTNKNASQQCEAFGAENETRTVSCNALKVSDLEEDEKTTGET